MVETSVDLGYLEDCEEWLLTNKFFPSKVGGKPAWLELRDIPKPSELQCKKCQEPLSFLCQIYASNDQVPQAFHRTIYVFICRNGDCCVDNSSDNLLILRSQLPRQNEFYSFEPANEDIKSDPVPSPVNLCRVCGCRGPQACSQCKGVNYCGVVHQRVDWKQRHKKECAEKIKVEGSSTVEFAEKELVIEAEELEPALVTHENGEEAEARRLKDYEELLKSGKAGLDEIPDSEIEKYVQEEKEDKCFSKFRERIKQNPDQVIRYDRGGAPLWITDEHQMKDEIPKCPNCDEARSFEFQIMPQLLNSLGTDNLDWGVIAVYTCSKDCNIGSKYVQEFAYKQDLTKE